MRTNEESQSLVWALSASGLGRDCSCEPGVCLAVALTLALHPAVSKWKKQCMVPLLAIPACVGFGIHQDKYR